MDRREFVQSALVTTALCASAANAARESFSRAGGDPTFAFYDPRFPQSLVAARRLAPRAEMRPITGDVSSLMSLLCTPERSSSQQIAGVTTESVPFCLEQLLSLHARPQLKSIRLDADLFAWTLIVDSLPPVRRYRAGGNPGA